MKKRNPIGLNVLFLIVFMLIGKMSGAQHLLEVGNTRKLIKVVSEHGGALYYQLWPDTNSGTRAVLLSDIKLLKGLSLAEADSVSKILTKQESEKIEKQEKQEVVKRETRKRTAMEVDMNTAITVNRMDIGCGFGLGVKGEKGVEVIARIGLDYTNQGWGFINTVQIPFGLNGLYMLNSSHWKKGIPFLQAMMGFNSVVSGRFDKSRDQNREYMKYPNNMLESNVFWGAGIGMTFDKTRIGVLYKMQGSNVTFPEIGIMHFVMIKLGVKLL